DEQSVPINGNVSSDDNFEMDDFECRLQLTKYLSRLNASTVAAKQCASYALKNRNWDEDLHSCILEQISQVRGEGMDAICSSTDGLTAINEHTSQSPLLYRRSL